MPYRQQQFVNGEIYHLVIRSIDDNLLFKNIDDYYRGIFSIYEFNNSNPVSIRERRKTRVELKAQLKKLKSNRSPSSGNFPKTGFGKLIEEIEKDTREKLVEILCFSFMPNHIHLLVRQIEDDGIEKFMRKTGTGYAKYFNKKYERKGYVFQNRFVSVNIKTDEQLKTVFVYIHANPISLIEPKWKEIGIENPDHVISFLENEYRWSSYFDYIGKQNFQSVTEREFMSNVMGGEQSCKKSVDDWVRFKGEMREFSDLALEL